MKTLIKIILFIGILIAVFSTYNELIAEHDVDCSIALNQRACTLDWMAYIERYDWDVHIAYKVMLAESDGAPRAKNPERHKGCSGSFGLFQVACVHDDEENLYDPEYNIAKAYEIYSKNGWKPWGAYTSGAYKRF